MVTIAICDDEEIQRNLLKKLVEAWAVRRNHALRVSLFASGKELLEGWKKERYDIVLLDIQMPDMDGMDAARRLRETDGQTGIFFVTGYEDYLVQGYEVEAFRYLLSLSPEPSVWAAWGAIIEKRAYLPGCVRDLVREGEEKGARWYCAGAVTKKGHPHHPLYLKKDEKLRPFDVNAYLDNLRIQETTP